MVLADGRRLGLPPNLAKLRQDAVSFSGHYTAANDCTPARSTLLTGLYTHQTGCMITGGSTLDPGFPTWGTMLREHGYRTRWYGKWHLTHRDGKWGRRRGERALQRYGFARGHLSRRPTARRARAGAWTGTSHGSSPGGSSRRAARGRGARPSRSSTPTTSPGGTCGAIASRAEASARPVVAGAAGELRDARAADGAQASRVLQRSLQDTAAASFGPVPYEGPEAA